MKTIKILSVPVYITVILLLLIGAIIASKTEALEMPIVRPAFPFSKEFYKARNETRRYNNSNSLAACIGMMHDVIKKGAKPVILLCTYRDYEERTKPTIYALIEIDGFYYSPTMDYVNRRLPTGFTIKKRI